MIWPFKKSKDEETKFEYRVIDWSKVTTTEDVVNILSNIGLTRRVKVGKIDWSDIFCRPCNPKQNL